MIPKLQRRFILTASIAVLIVLTSVVSIINGTMHGILNLQTNHALDELLKWQGTKDTAKSFLSRPITDTMLNNHYFCVLLNPNNEILAIDLSYDSILEEEDVLALIGAAIEKNDISGQIGYGGTKFAYKIMQLPDSGNTKMAFLDRTPALNTLHRLHQASVIIGFMSSVGSVIVFTLFSKRAINPLIKNMENQKRFITNASHELKTPLAIISANIELLEAMNGENEWTRNTINQTVRMTELVNELISLSKVSELNKLETHNVDFSEIVQAAANGIAPVIYQQEKTFKSTIETNVHVKGDERLLQMLVNILLENASKYCDDRGTIEVALSIKGRKNKAFLSVSNDYADGSGVDYERFFERFYQEEQSHNSSKSGFGIGLSIAQEIVFMMKGGVHVNYREGRITFQVSFASLKNRTF